MKNRKKKHDRITVRKRFVQILSLFLTMSIFTNTIPAAPAVIANSSGEVYQDFRFAFLSNQLALEMPNILGLFYKINKGGSKKNVSEIKIYPGSLAVKQGQTVIFSAVGYDGQNEPQDGLRFNWKMADVGRGFEERDLPDGIFEATIPGTFKVTAESLGITSEVTIEVAETGIIPLADALNNGGQTKRISLREGDTEKETEEKEDKNTTENNMSGNPNNWNSTNWDSADDPGNQPGNPPGQAADEGAGSGNFQMTAPVVSLPGRGIDISLNLHYNSRLWNKSGSELTYDIDHGFPAPGWSLGFGKLMYMGEDKGTMLIDADGTRHGYSGTLSPPNASPNFKGHTADGTLIDYSSDRDYAGSNGIIGGHAYFPNGTSVTYGAPGDKAAYPTKIRDNNGNYISITYVNNQGPRIQTITDTMGRVITFEYDSTERLIAVNVPRMTSGTRTAVKLHYDTLNLNYSFTSGITAVVPNGPIRIIDSIYYPGTQTGFWFDDADSYSSYGMLSKVVEQRGMNWVSSSEPQGTIVAGQTSKLANYNYPLTTANQAGRTNGVSLSDAPTYSTMTETWDGMDDTASVTTYNVQTNASPRTSTVVQPNGTVVRQYSYNYSSLPNNDPNKFKDGLVYLDETYIPDTGGVSIPNIPGTFKLVNSSNVSWELGEYDSARPTQAEITDENGKKIRTVYEYTGGKFNQVTRSCDYDHNWSKLKCSVTEYENSSDYIGRYTQTGFFDFSPHVYNLVKSSAVENPDGTKASLTVYEYDNYQAQGFTPATGAGMFEASYDIYTTQTIQVPYQCLQWVQTPVGTFCVQWSYQTVSAYKPATEKRGNVTKTTVYADAQNLTGAQVELKKYDVTGNATKTSLSTAQHVTYQYSLTNQFAYIESQTKGSDDVNSADRITSSFSYDFRTGLVLTATDGNGRTGSTAYDSESLRPTTTTSSTGAYKTYTYNDAAMSVVEETRQNGGALAGKNTKFLNGIGQIKREEVDSPGTGGLKDIVETKYNKIGEVWKKSRPYRTGETPIFTETLYDAQGRISQTIEPNGSTARIFYNETARPDSASTEIGSTIRVVDEWGRERWGRYDQRGKLAEMAEPNPNGNGSVFASGSLATKYVYDTLGNISQIEQGSQIRKFKFDGLGRLTRQKLAEQEANLDDNGVFVGSGLANSKWGDAFFYDGKSNMVQKTDPRGVKFLYSYNKPNGSEDPLNRLHAVVYDLSGPLAQGHNIPSAPGVTYEYMTTGDKARVKKIRTAGILTEDYLYDTEGRVSEYSQTVDYRQSFPMTTSYIYDSLDRATDIRYPAQWGLAGNPRKLVQPVYDNDSRLSAMSVDGQTQVSNIVYNAADQTTSISVGPAGKRQVTESFEYDNLTGQMTRQVAESEALGSFIDLSYDYQRYNSAGNANGKTGHLSKIVNNLDNSKNREYEYDALGRLKKAKGGINLWTQEYSYDRYGNRTNVVASGFGVNSMPIAKDGFQNATLNNISHNAQNNRITNAGFQYDSAGNLVRALAEDGVTWLRYEYDAANRLQIIKRDSDGTYLQAFQYGSNNSRLMDIDYNVGFLNIFARVNGNTLAEYTEYQATIMTWTKSYTYLGDSLLSTISPNGGGGETTEFNHPDRLGTKAVTNQNDGTFYEQAALPFGTALQSETTGTNSRVFTSYERSNRTGLDYALNRTYDSKLGRFTQVDPSGMASVNLFNPQTLNLYSYCANDPINHTDPTGLFWGKLFKWILKILKWIAVAVSIAVAVVVIVYAPYLFSSVLNAIFGIVAAVANAASGVLDLLGLKKAAAILGIISAAAALGTAILGFANLAKKSITRAIIAIVSSAANLASKVLAQLGYSTLSKVFGLISSVSGFFSKGLKQSWWKWYKFVKGTVQKVADLAGARKLSNFLSALGIIEDVVDLYNALKSLAKISETVSKKDKTYFGKKIVEDADGNGVVTPIEKISYDLNTIDATVALTYKTALDAFAKVLSSTSGIITKTSKFIPAPR